MAFDIYNYSGEDRDVIIKNFNNPWWQNVAIFYAGMSKDSSSFLNDILANSEPFSLYEMVSNTGGMGLLLQALYNTPLDDRLRGVERSLDNMCNAITAIKDNPDKHKFWQHFSEYGLMQVFSSFFAINHWSITLVEAMKKEFTKLFSVIDAEKEDETQKWLEFKMFMLCAVLASDDFMSFEEYRKLVEGSRSSSLNLFAVLDMHRRRLLKKLGDVAKSDEDYMRASKKLIKKGNQLGDISGKVNVPLMKALKSSKEASRDNEDEM